MSDIAALGLLAIRIVLVLLPEIYPCPLDSEVITLKTLLTRRVVMIEVRAICRGMTVEAITGDLTASKKMMSVMPTATDIAK